MLVCIRDRTWKILFLSLLVAATALRLYRLDHFSYWLDEVIEVRFAQEAPPQFWKDLKYDGFHPPLDYLIVRGLEKLGPTDWQRRLLPVAWGIATMALLGLLVGRRAGRVAGLLAMALLAAAPVHVRYSQELRPYSLALLLLCLSLWLLADWLERAGIVRLLLLYLSCLATAYTLYLAAFVLGIAAAGMLIEDAFAADPRRRARTRNALRWSPAFIAALFVGYLPWWPVVLDVSRRRPLTSANPITFERIGRVLSFFSFAPDERTPLGVAGTTYMLLVLAGLFIAARTAGIRFLLFWGIGGFVAIEILSQIHPHYDAARRFLPAAVALTAAAAVALSAMADRRVARAVALVLLVAIFALDGRGLRVYFRQGRPDWRKLARQLQSRVAPGEKVFSENQWTQMCLGLYMTPHDRGRHHDPYRLPVLNLDGEIARLTWSWTPGTRAWLVCAGSPHYERLRRWSEPFDSFQVPEADGATVFRLDSDLRDAAFARVRP